MMKKMSISAKIRRFLDANPNAPVELVANKFKTSKAYVYLVRSAMDKDAGKTSNKTKAPKQPVNWKTLSVTSSGASILAPVEEPAVDMVNHPPHYRAGGIETIDFIEAKGLNYHLGNVVKYVTRADLKGDRIENLKKAKWYLDREIAQASK